MSDVRMCDLCDKPFKPNQPWAMRMQIQNINIPATLMSETMKPGATLDVCGDDNPFRPTVRKETRQAIQAQVESTLESIEDDEFSEQ